MSDHRVRISLADLPLRARPLSNAELENVFGGCGSAGRLCREQQDCCTSICHGFRAGYRLGTCA